MKKILVILFIAFTANCFSQTPLKKPVYWYFIGDTIYASIDGKNEAVLVVKGLNGSSASSDSTSDPGFASKNYVKLLNKLNVKYADSIALMESQYRTNKLLEDYFARIDTQYYYKRAQIDVILNGYQPLIVGLNSAAKTDSNWYEARRDTNKVGHAVTLNHALELFALIATVSFPGFGTSHSTAAYGDHSHNGVYLPVSGAGDIYTHNASEFVTTVTVNDTAHTEAKVKKIIAGSNVTLSPGSGLGDVTINATSGGGGEANTASNLAGLGVGLFKTKIGVDLAFKKLKQLGYIIINDMTDSVAIIPDTSAGKLATKTDLLSKVDNTAIIDTPNIQMTKIEAWVIGRSYVTGTPWTGMGYVTSSATWDTSHIAMNNIEAWVFGRGFVTGTPWTGMGYVTGTPWTGVGYWYSGSHPSSTSDYGLPAYPTTLPASDVYAWAKASTKPSYTYTEVGADASGAAAAITLSGLGGVPSTRKITSSIDLSADRNLTYSDVGAAASSHTQAISTISDASTVGQNIVKLTNPSAITFLRMNANNSVDALSASDFRTAIGTGTGTGDQLKSDSGKTNIAGKYFSATSGKALIDSTSKYKTGMVNIDYFGAVHDGSNQNTAVQAALAAGAKVIFIPANTTWQPPSGLIPAGLTIYGEDWYSSKIRSDATGSIALKAGAGVKIFNCNLLGSTTATDSCMTAFFCNATDSIANIVETKHGSVLTCVSGYRNFDVTGIYAQTLHGSQGDAANFSTSTDGSGGGNALRTDAYAGATGANQYNARHFSGAGVQINDEDGTATIGTRLSFYSTIATGGEFMSVNQRVSTFTGDVISLSMADISGSFGGNFANFMVGGVTKFKVDYNGDVTGGNYNGHSVRQGASIYDTTHIAKTLFTQMTSNQHLAASSVTLQNVTQLVLAVEANSTYKLELQLASEDSSNSIDSTGVSFKLTAPSGATSIGNFASPYTIDGILWVTISLQWDLITNASGTAMEFGYGFTRTLIAGTYFPAGSYNATIITSSTAGNLQLQAAQLIPHGWGTRVLKGSYMMLTKVN